MKILWLSPTSSRYKNEEAAYHGGGWIESLQLLVENCKEIDQLGIVFLHAFDSERLRQNKVIYYPIKKTKPGNVVSRIISNWGTTIDSKEYIEALKPIIKDFNPDVIHIFGTESWQGHVVKMTDIPCIVHLQGLLLPYLNAFIPNGLSEYDLIKTNWRNFIKGSGFWHNKRVLEKFSKREYGYFKQISYFMGRTDWDKSISGFLSPKSIYFHEDEVLREIFYSSTPWTYNKNSKTIITSTISDTLYKGLDLVIKTAKLLTIEGFEFEWRIIGVNENSNISLLFKNHLSINYSSININLLGVKKTEELIALLSQTTIYVHPTYMDNSPNSLCEAQLMGIPVIATYVGGVSSLIENTKDGFLVPANDPYLLASKIGQIIHNEIDLTEISKQAREKALTRHSREKIIKRLIEIYNLLQQKGNC